VGPGPGDSDVVVRPHFCFFSVFFWFPWPNGWTALVLFCLVPTSAHPSPPLALFGMAFRVDDMSMEELDKVISSVQTTDSQASPAAGRTLPTVELSFAAPMCASHPLLFPHPPPPMFPVVVTPLLPSHGTA
jgi:hypothetical protein